MLRDPDDTADFIARTRSETEGDSSIPVREPPAPDRGVDAATSVGISPQTRSESERLLPDDPDPDDPADRFIELLSRWELGTVHRVIALADRLGLSLRAFLVLSELAIRPSGLTNVQITGIVGLPSATVTEIVAGLVRAGLVDRGPDPFDGRQIVSGATDAARILLADEARSDLAVRDLLGDLTSDRLAVVESFIDRATTQAYRESRAYWQRRRR